MKTSPINVSPDTDKAGSPEKRHSPEASDSEAPGLASKSKNSEEPKTFELAMLATHLMVAPKSKLRPPAAVKQAMAIWRAARDFKLAEKQLEELLAGVFKLTPNEWTERINDYRGVESELNQILLQTEYHFETEVLPRLFSAPGYSARQRLKRFEELLQKAAKQAFDVTLYETNPLVVDIEDGVRYLRLDGVEKPKPKAITIDDFLGKSLNVFAIRRLMEARALKKVARSS